MKVKTTNVEQVWQSPDAQRTIWEVALQADNGQEYRLKTYSPKISQMGFSGEVESYVNNRGERFVRQAASQKPAYTRDDNAIRAQWAIGQAINLASVKMDKDQITLPIIEEYAKQLFATVSRVKGEPVTPDLKEQAAQYIRSFTQAPAMS